MNALERHLRESWDLKNAPIEQLRVNQFDWESHGVSSKFVIAITARSGSTWLAHMLKSTGMCGNPLEHFNVEALLVKHMPSDVSGFRELFAHKVGRQSVGGAFGFEANYDRFTNFMSLVDVDKVFLDSGARFVYLTRRDLLSQAISVVTAIDSGVWHKFTGGPEQASGKNETDPEERALWRSILNFVEEEQHWETYFDEHRICPLRVTYEDIVTNPGLQVLRIASYLRPDRIGSYADISDVVDSLNNGTEKLAGKKTEMIWAEFRIKYQSELEELERLRTTFDRSAFTRHLNKTFKLKL